MKDQTIYNFAKRLLDFFSSAGRPWPILPVTQCLSSVGNLERLAL